MRLLKVLGLGLAGATMMLATLMWIAQFFTRDGDVTPVIWIESLQQDAQKDQEEDFAEFQEKEGR